MQPDQIQAVLEALEEEPINFKTMIHLFIVTGCRRGEIMAMKWEKVNFERGEILIDLSMSYLQDRGIYEGPTKTGKARYISVPRQTVSLLKKYRTWQMEQRLKMGDLWQDNGLLFTRQNGAPLNPGAINMELTLFCERHGLPHLNPHLFRHSVASILLSNGVDVLTVSSMLGHADTSTTLDVYAHEIEEARRKTAECVSEIILDKKNA